MVKGQAARRLHLSVVKTEVKRKIKETGKLTDRFQQSPENHNKSECEQQRSKENDSLYASMFIYEIKKSGSASIASI